MPRMFVSVLLLAVLVVMTILSAGVGVGRLGRWWAQSQQPPRLKAERLREQQRKLEEQQAARDTHARRLGWIANYDRVAERYPDRAAVARRQANALRKTLGLPLRDYASEPASSEEPVTYVPQREPAPPTAAVPVPEIRRLANLPSWF
jgi:hypothetical protein